MNDDRLTVYTPDGYGSINPVDLCLDEYSDINFERILDKLGKYEDLEEQERLIKLPCKFGTEVYNITWWDDVQEKVVAKGKIYCRTVRKHKVTKSIFSCFDILEFGKTVFLTRKEAEAKLKEMEDGKE